ncbi:energy transducer TonB, partial [bacterium]|nr:energy transducer TonB [bacterium]
NVKKYPLIARSKGKEGSVVVEFTLHLDGSISDILILERASFSSFNDAAITAVNSAAPFEPIPAVLGISKMSISVRLTFQLNQ